VKSFRIYSFYWNFFFFYLGTTALVGQGLLIVEDSRIGNNWAGQIMRMELVEGGAYLVEISI